MTGDRAAAGRFDVGRVIELPPSEYADRRFRVGPASCSNDGAVRRTYAGEPFERRLASRPAPLVRRISGPNPRRRGACDSQDERSARSQSRPRWRRSTRCRPRPTPPRARRPRSLPTVHRLGRQRLLHAGSGSGPGKLGGRGGRSAAAHESSQTVLQRGPGAGPAERGDSREPDILRHLGLYDRFAP